LKLVCPNPTSVAMSPGAADQPFAALSISMLKIEAWHLLIDA